MKKIFVTVAALLLCGNLLMAQSPEQRSVKTLAADVLAQMPADQQENYNTLIGQLSEGGEEGVLNLVGKIKAYGDESNVAIDYALSGLSHYVMARGEETERLAVSQAYCKALGMVNDEEAKAFIIRQLQIVGKAEAVETLTEYLHDPRLSGEAARALASNGTEEAANALRSGLKVHMGTPETQKNIIAAIADAQVSGTEEILLPMLAGGDEDMKKLVFHALGCVGSTESLKTLSDAAEDAGYTMEKMGANEAYIALIKRIAASGDVKTAEKEANSLMKKAAKAGKVQTREAALEILLSLKTPRDATKMVLTALKDDDKGYRNAALSFASAFADEAVYIELVKAMNKAKTEPKIDILNWLGREASDAKKQAVLQKLMIRFDLPAKTVLLKQMEKGDYRVMEATVWALTRIGDTSVIPNLAQLLESEDKDIVLLGQDALAVFKGDIADAIVKEMGKASSAGKIAGIELLALRRADAKINTVLEQTNSSDKEVKTAAYKALKSLATAQDFTQLCGMLESVDDEYRLPMQEAVAASVISMPKDTQISTLKRRMLQAGVEKSGLYYKVLAATGDPEAFSMIQEGLQSNRGEIKSAALNALLEWRGIEAAESLYDICQTTKLDDVFDRALNRYVELVSAPSITPENRLLRLRKAMAIVKTPAQKVLILEQIKKTGTFLALMYSAEFLNDSDASVRSAATYAVWNIASEHKEYAGTNVREILNRILPMLDGPDARYERDAVSQYLAEMPEETGFVSIFNGKDLTGWKGLVENPIARSKMKPEQLAEAQVKADELMRRDWKVENGLLLFDGKGYDNLCTEKQYGDIEMYVDWMLDPAGPEADAGIYLRGTPQVQIWDTARVNVGAQVGSGGLYNNQTNESKPLKVADNKLGEWNTFYIKMVGDRVTVYLNGELVTDNVIMENYWDRSLPIPATDQIELQAHGSKVYYRDIYVKELKRAEPFTLPEEEEKEGFKILFDGTNMHEWTGNTTDYILEDGCISMNPSRSFGGNLYSKGEYANFILRFDYQLTPGANNGVGLRTPMEGDAAYVGMESQILDCEHPIYSDITQYQHHGAIYGILPTNENHKTAIKPAGEWNSEEIVCDSDNIRVSVNGVVIVEGNIREAVENGTPDGKEHPGLFNKKGHIGFLGHGSPIKFKNIRIKELK